MQETKHNTFRCKYPVRNTFLDQHLIAVQFFRLSSVIIWICTKIRNGNFSSWVLSSIAHFWTSFIFLNVLLDVGMALVFAGFTATTGCGGWAGWLGWAGVRWVGSIGWWFIIFLSVVRPAITVPCSCWPAKYHIDIYFYCHSEGRNKFVNWHTDVC